MQGQLTTERLVELTHGTGLPAPHNLGTARVGTPAASPAKVMATVTVLVTTFTAWGAVAIQTAGVAALRGVVRTVVVVPPEVALAPTAALVAPKKPSPAPPVRMPMGVLTLGPKGTSVL